MRPRTDESHRPLALAVPRHDETADFRGSQAEPPWSAVLGRTALGRAQRLLGPMHNRRHEDTLTDEA